MRQASDNSMILKSALMAIIIVLAIVTVACTSGGGGQSAFPAIDDTPTPQTHPTSQDLRATPSPEPESTSTPVDAPETRPPAIEIPPVSVDTSTLTVPVCRTTTSVIAGSGFGTVPHATPTPIPAPGSSMALPGAEAEAFVVGLKPLVNAIVSLTTAADQSWLEASGRDDLARAILYEGRRLSQLCAALAILPLTTESQSFVAMTADALNGRRSVLANSGEFIRDEIADPLAKSEAREMSSIGLTRLGQQLDEYAESVNVTLVEASSFTTINPLLGVAFDASAGWLAARNGIDIVLIAPIEQQIYSVRGLGPDAWRLGTAFRVRRFRNATTWTLSDTAASLDPLYVRYGERVSDRSISIGGNIGIVRNYKNPDRGWNTLVATTVVGNSTYLFEFGCPDELDDGCSEILDGFLRSVVFSGG